jgi:carboxylesterase type B
VYYYNNLFHISLFLNQPPVEVKPWNGVWDAGDFGSFCMAYEHVIGPVPDDPIKGQEDCLFLNIYTPSIPEAELKDEELMDVIFYIHGGAFMFGRSNFYGAKYFIDRKIIWVTINYRVGPLGMYIIFQVCISTLLGHGANADAQNLLSFIHLNSSTLKLFIL